MTDYPKTLILTTNRTEDGAPVYAPCGDLRDLIAEWRKRADEISPQAILDSYCAGRRDRLLTCANQLEAALKPSGELFTAKPSKIEIAYGEPAAGPLEIGVEYPKEEINT
jgi:hypothetical protein